MDFGFFIVLLIVFCAMVLPIFILCFFMYNHSREREEKKEQYYLSVMNAVRRNDCFFDEDSFKKNASRCIYEIFNCFYNLDLKHLRTLESSDLYDIHKMDIETGLISGYLTTLVIPPDINFVIEKYYVDGDKEIICCSAVITSKEIVFDPKTKEILNSDEQNHIYCNVKLEFARHLGVKTVIGREFVLKECPNCGADIVAINEYGKCSYCDSVIVNGEHSWVLNKISEVIIL